MSSRRPGRAALLRPALEAARRALQRLDADEIPAGLRKVAASSGGRLPPPLARKLIEELDASGWLRDQALEQFDDPEPEAADPARAASSLFLTRPDGWWIELTNLERGRAEEERGADVERLEAELAAAEKRAAQAQRKAKARAAELDEVVREAAARVDDERRRIAGADGERRARLAAADAAAAAAEERLAQETSARTAADRFAARLREDLRKARRERADAVRRLSAGDASSIGREPRALARALDELAERARPLLEAAPTMAVAGSVGTLALPAGVAPDQPAAFDWLAAQEREFLLLVDGYNVAHQLSPTDLGTSLARRRVNVELARAAQRLRSRSSVVVVYDSALEGERRTAAGERGVEVVFAEAGRLADEEIVARAAAATVPAVVVSTDREVREEAAAAGALPLWSEALIGWLRRAV